MTRVSKPSESMASVERMIAVMDDAERHETLLSYMQYPKTEKLIKHDTPICICNYSCEQDKCDFSTAVSKMKKNVDVQAFGSQTFLEEVHIYYKNVS